MTGGDARCEQIQEEESCVSFLLDYLPGGGELSGTCQGRGEAEGLEEPQPTLCLLQMLHLLLETQRTWACHPLHPGAAAKEGAEPWEAACWG